MAALLVGTALVFGAGGVFAAGAPGAGEAQRPAPPPGTPTRAGQIMQAAQAASRIDPAKWDWPAAATPEVRKEIIEGGYTPEELRNIFIILARSSGDQWPSNGVRPTEPGNMNAPGFVFHGRGFRGLEAFYGSNGYTGGVSDRVNKVDTLIAHGDRVYISWIIEGRHTGKLFGFPATGKQIQVRESGMNRFTKDGLTIEVNDIGDDLALYTQAGGKLSFPDKPQ
jgi:predicted ester cyclase